MSEVAVKFTADEAALWRGINRLVSSHTRHAEALDDTKKKAAALDPELARFAKRAKDIDSTPVERWGEKVTKLKAALAANLLTQEQFNRSMKSAATELKKSTTVVDEEAEALKRFASGLQQIDQTPLERHAQALNKLKASRAANLITQEQFARAEQRISAELAKATTVVDQEAVALQRFGDQLKQIHATPLDNYTAAIQRARAALAAGTIDQKTFDAEAAKQTATLRTATTVVDQEAEAIKRFGQQLRQIHSTPLENYHAALGKARQALAAGAIDQRTFNAEAAKQNEILTKATTVTDAAAAELKQFAAETKKLNTTPLENYHAKIKRLDEAVKAGVLSHRDYTTAVQREKETLDRANESLGKKNGTQATSSGLINAAVGKLGAWAAAYFTVQKAIQAVTQAMQEKMQVEKEALDSQERLAKSQSDAAKNLAALSPAETEKILTLDAPEIQKKTGFPDQPKIVEAIGAGFSSSGDKDLTIDAVTAAAEITPHTPEQIKTVTAGILDISRGSGVTDPRAISGFLLSAGGPNRIDRPEKLAENLAPVVSAGVSYVPDQQKTAASKDIAALFATTTKFLVDKEGDKSKTNVNQMLSRIDTVFKEFPELDPGTIRGRVEAIQQNPKLRESLFETEWGDASSKKLNQDIFTKDSAADKDVIQSRTEIRFDKQIHENLVKQVNEATPQIKRARERQKTKADVEAHQQKTPAAFNASVEEQVTTVMRQTRGDGGFLGLPGAATFVKEKFGAGFRNYAVSEENRPKEALDNLHNRKMREAYGSGFYPGTTSAQRFDLEADSKRLNWSPEQKANVGLLQGAQDRIQKMIDEREQERAAKKETQTNSEADKKNLEAADKNLAAANMNLAAAEKNNAAQSRQSTTQRTGFSEPARAIAGRQPE